MQAATPLFSATLTPHRAASRRTLRFLVALAAVIATVPVVILWSGGLWLLLGVMAADVLLIAWAFSASMRDARRREMVALWSDRLEVKTVGANGREALATFNPVFVRLAIARDYDERTTGLTLRERGQVVEIGSFLNAEEKGSFARAFGTALRRARQPGSTEAPERHRRS